MFDCLVRPCVLRPVELHTSIHSSVVCRCFGCKEILYSACTTTSQSLAYIVQTVNGCVALHIHCSTTGECFTLNVQEEEAEDLQQYELEITVSDPEKVGDGMGAYIVYCITTKTTVPAFKSPEASVRRRFSDFLRLHNKMAETHLPKGRIVPPAPEKSVRG